MDTCNQDLKINDTTPKSFLFTVFLCSAFLTKAFFAHAQQKPVPKNTTPDKKHSNWQAGITYQSDEVWLGRKDSVAVPYITPSIGYHHKSGLSITGSIAYLPGNDGNRIDRGSIEAGYSYASDKFNAEIEAGKDFFSDQSYAVNSEVKGRLSANLSYDLDFIELFLEPGASFSDNPDFGLGFGGQHSFSMAEDKLNFSPSFRLNAATQNYYASYYSKRKYSPKRNGGKKGAGSGTGSGPLTASVANASKFQVMDYELSAPIEYKWNKWTLNCIPTLAIPVSPSTVTTFNNTNGTTITTVESLQNSFYLSLGVSYTF